MKRLITNLQNIWKVEELRKRILLTLGLILTYRVGSFVILPGVKYDALTSTATDQNFLESILSVFSGGGFTNASIMALGIMPYISASIIMQLLGMAVPAVQKMQNEGESGRKQINNYTRLLTIVICALQAPSYLTLYVSNKNAMPDNPDTFWWTQTIMLLIAGSMLAATQCTASEAVWSTMERPHVTVPAGSPEISKLGESLEPSHVNNGSISPPSNHGAVRVNS